MSNKRLTIHHQSYAIYETKKPCIDGACNHSAAVGAVIFVTQPLKMADNFKVPKLPAFLHRKKESSSKSSEEITSSSCTGESNDSNNEKPKEEETAETIHDGPAPHVDKPRDEPVLELSYNEPVWSGRPPSSSFLLSVIKNGVQVDSVSLNSSYVLFGRLPQCDVHLEHPSISRHHAILQYRPTPSATPVDSSSLSADPTGDAGFYLYDLGSTHGSYLNKNKLQPRKYYRVRVGQVMKFGGSTRIFVLDVSEVILQAFILAHVHI